MSEPWRIRTSKPKSAAKPKRDAGAVIRAWLGGTNVAPRARPTPRPTPLPTGARLSTRHGKKLGSSSGEGLSEITRDAYQRDWNRFVTWCKANRVKALPCTPQNLIRYLDHRAADTTRTVIEREVTTINRTHRVASEDSPRSHPLVRKWLRNFRDNPPPAKTTAAPPIHPDHLHAMVSHIHNLATVEPATDFQRRRRVVALRDRAMIVIGKAAALRAADYHKLTRADVKVVRAGLELTLHRSTEPGATTTIILARVKPAVLCPVDAWRAWVQDVPADPSSPAFPLLRDDSPRNKSVTPTDICITIKRALHAVGVDPAPYTEESLAAV